MLSVPDTEELEDLNVPACPEEGDGVAEAINVQPEVLTSLETANETKPPRKFDVKVLDGTAVLHFLPTAGIATFRDYAKKVFLPFLRNQLNSVKRLDMVWDTYKKNNIKETTREKRGKGVRKKVEAQNKIPGKWQDFLRDPDNKKELFAFLTNEIKHCEFPSYKEVIVTPGDAAVCRGSDHHIPHCDHEEADTRMVYHMQDAIKNGQTSCLIRTVDTDVIVILTGKYFQFCTICPAVDIWVAFGVGRKFNYLTSIHSPRL